MQASDDDPLLTTTEAAALLGVRPTTLEAWRFHRRYSLPYVKVGRVVRYQKSVVMRFMAERTVAA